jgi:hypothetical protein
MPRMVEASTCEIVMNLTAGQTVGPNAGETSNLGACHGAVQTNRKIVELLDKLLVKPIIKAPVKSMVKIV